jgi:zinc protease
MFRTIWSNALAVEHRYSPDEDIEAIRKVTRSDVDRVAAQYLNTADAVVGTVIPAPAQQPTPGRRIAEVERAIAPPDSPVKLPWWAADDLEELTMPTPHAMVSDTVLENGLRLIVETDSTSPTVLLRGCVKHTIEPQSTRNAGALSDVLEGFYEDGTQEHGPSHF